MGAGTAQADGCLGSSFRCSQRAGSAHFLHRMGFSISGDGNSGIYLPPLRITYYRGKKQAESVQGRDASAELLKDGIQKLAGGFGDAQCEPYLWVNGGCSKEPCGARGWHLCNGDTGDHLMLEWSTQGVG